VDEPLAGIDRDARLSLVRGTADPTLDGIDFVEVVANRPGTPGVVRGVPAQRTLLVHLLHGPVPASLDATRVRVIGGVRPDPRLNPVRALWAWPAAAIAAGDPLPLVTEADRRLVRAAVPAADRSRVLVVRTSSSGDWSTYVLRLLGADGRTAPDGFDEPLAEFPFAFTVDCPSDLDCRAEVPPAPVVGPAPVTDYLARDYAGLRSRLLDRVATSLPQWMDDNPADVGVTLVELFAYLGDRLAYWQDAVAAEAYLGTSRRRTSLRRHARLLDYRVHEGCSARAWLSFTTRAVVELPVGTPVADFGPPGATTVDALEAGAVVFETRVPARLRPDRNRLDLHSWGDPDHCLPAGATSAYVALPAGAAPGLAAGDVLVLAELGADGTPETGDPARRFPVRLDRPPASHDDPIAGVRVLELHWHAADALPTPLRVARRGEGAQPRVTAVALANVVLADHGGSISDEQLSPPQVPMDGDYRPRLRRVGLAFAEPYTPANGLGATESLRPDPRAAAAQLLLHDGLRTWEPRPDLIASGRLDAHVVVETDGGEARLRFGDGILGRRPTAGTSVRAWYRVTGGVDGNVGAGALAVLLRLPDGRVLDEVRVTNPTPAAGGVVPQPLAEVRQLVPHAFRTQLRAVTSADYAAEAMRNAAVQRAVGRRRWTGSWYAQEVTVDPLAARATDPALRVELTATLETRRMAGVDVELAGPVYVPLDIVLTACLRPGYLRSGAAGQLRDLLGARVLPDGRRGFFHPDNFTFGQPVFLSDLVAVIMAVPGVSWVDADDRPPAPNRFRRMGRPRGDEVRLGRIDVGAREVVRADSDPNNPEAGRIEILLRGGS
jgi:hypothetical protein